MIKRGEFRTIVDSFLYSRGDIGCIAEDVGLFAGARADHHQA